MADSVSALYPQPAQPTQGLLNGDPSKLISTLSGLNQFQMIAKTLAAKQAVGSAFQQSLRPDGTVDLDKTADIIKNDPNAAFMGQEATSGILSQRKQQIENNTSAFDLTAKQNGFVQQWLAGRSNQPNVTSEDLHNDAVTLSRNTGIPSEMINGVIDSITNDPKGIKNGLVTLQNRLMGAATAAGRVEGPPTAEGAPQKVPLGAAGYGTQAAGGATMQTGLSPAETAAQTASGSASGTASAGALGGAANYASRVTPLTKIVHLLDEVGPTGQGIGTESTNTVKNIAEGLGIIKPGSTKPVEELRKYYTQNVLRNADIGSTDKMVAAFHGAPNIDLNQASASDLAKTDLSLQRLAQAQALEGVHVPKDKYQEWAAQFNNQQDPIAYGFDLMSADAQKKYLASMKPGSDEYNRFKTSLGIAHRHKLLEKQNGG